MNDDDNMYRNLIKVNTLNTTLMLVETNEKKNDENDLLKIKQVNDVDHCIYFSSFFIDRWV